MENKLTKMDENEYAELDTKFAGEKPQECAHKAGAGKLPEEE